MFKIVLSSQGVQETLESGIKDKHKAEQIKRELNAIESFTGKITVVRDVRGKNKNRRYKKVTNLC